MPTATDAKLNIISHIRVAYLRNAEETTAADAITITAEKLRSLIEETAAKKNNKVEPTVAVEVTESTGASFIETLWEPTKGDFHAAVKDTVSPYARFDCLVVDEVVSNNMPSSSSPSSSSSTIASIADGEIIYALFEKRIPVLRLVNTKKKETTTEASSSFSSSLSSSQRVHKMLTTVEINANADADSVIIATQKQAAIAAFFTFPEFQGRVIVVEGGDGAGKQTQVKKLYDRINEEGYLAETLDYPHDAAGYGVLIRELLSGKMGNIKEVNPLIFATLYGINRHSTLPLLKYWIQRGANIILDRYMTANFGHQASKYEKDEDRIAAINTLRTFELRWLNLPDADKVFYLNLPPDFALKAMQTDTTRRELDMHELAGIEYKNNVRKSFLWCCETFSSVWKEIACVDAEEKARFSREEVHATIYAEVAPLLVNKRQ